MKPRAINIHTNELLPPALVGVMVLLDRSGSMAAIQAPMEQAFAEFVAQQRSAGEDGLWLTLHQFDHESYDVTYDRASLSQVGGLGLVPRGNTPLVDCLWQFGLEARRVIDDPADETERLLLVVVTDGQENASKARTWSQVKELFDGLEGADCETIWLGTTAAIMEAQAAMPTFAQAGATLGYAATAQGVAYAYGGLSSSTLAYRAGHSARSAMRDYTSGTSAFEGTVKRGAR